MTSVAVKHFKGSNVLVKIANAYSAKEEIKHKYLSAAELRHAYVSFITLVLYLLMSHLGMML